MVVELSDLKVASNGGDREAREKIQAIYDLLDNAIEGHSLHPIDMMAMRLNALPPVKTELPKVIKCYVSVCDGSGTRSLFVTQRVGAHYQLASVMVLPTLWFFRNYQNPGWTIWFVK